MEFTRTRKGYNPTEVDEYIAAQHTRHEDQVETLKARVEMLTECNEELNRTLDAMRRNETRVTRLLTDVQAMAERAEQEAARYREEEMRRLELFRTKWVDYAAAYLGRELPDFTEKLLRYRDEFSAEFRHMLSTDLFLLSDPLYAEYHAERMRIKEDDSAPIHIEELLKKLREHPDEG